jgi:2'-5' RNA ligase
VDYDLSMLRTGLIVEVPDAEHVVADWREQLDPHAMLGVPAHVTVLFPFAASDRIDEGILTALRQVLPAVEPFEFRLPRTGWFGESVLWLAPEPGAPFRHLTEVLTATFPDYPPFGGQFAEIVPHLTVGDHGTEQQLSAAERDVQRHLPIHSNAQSVTLMAEQADGRWHRKARLAFGHRHPGRGPTCGASRFLSPTPGNVGDRMDSGELHPGAGDSDRLPECVWTEHGG